MSFDSTDFRERDFIQKILFWAFEKVWRSEFYQELFSFHKNKGHIILTTSRSS